MTILRRLASSPSYPRQNGLAAALRELGRLERTLFTLDWLEDAELRRQTSQELNKGESRNSHARAVFIQRLGEIRDRTYENQQHRASGLNLLVTAIILWNTRYLEATPPALRPGQRSTRHLIERAVQRLIRAGGRETEADAAHLLEGIGVIAYDPTSETIDPDLPARGSGLRWEEFVDALAKSYEARFEA